MGVESAVLGPIALASLFAGGSAAAKSLVPNLTIPKPPAPPNPVKAVETADVNAARMAEEKRRGIAMGQGYNSTVLTSLTNPLGLGSMNIGQKRLTGQ